PLPSGRFFCVPVSKPPTAEKTSRCKRLYEPSRESKQGRQGTKIHPAADWQGNFANRPTSLRTPLIVLARLSTSIVNYHIIDRLSTRAAQQHHQLAPLAG